MIDAENIYGKGVLVSVHMGGYEGRKKLSEEQLKGLPTEIVRGVHDLFDHEFKELLKEIWNHDTRIRDGVAYRTVAFPIGGFFFLKADRVGKMIEWLEEQKQKRDELIQNAVDAYEEAITRFQEKYPEYYQRSKGSYLNKSQFQARWYFKYHFVKIAPPDDSSILTSEMYQEEMKKFRQSIEEMKTETLSAIASTLLDTTTRLKEQCDNNKPNQRTLTSLGKFLDRIEEVYSDFIDRKDMNAVISSIRQAAAGVSSERLRGNQQFAEEFRNQMAAAAKTIQALPDIPLKRAIDL